MSSIAVRNPRTGQFDYRVAVTSAAEVAAASLLLNAAQPAWAARTVEERAAIVRRWAESLEKYGDEITAALTMDTGRHFLSGFELKGTIDRINHWCELAPGTLNNTASGASTCVPTVEFKQQLVPYSLVAIISPWNFPMTLGLIDAIPALLAGCAVYLKPSEVTPRFAEPLLASIREVPELARVFDIAIGGKETGIAMIDHCDAVCFTGSVGTGRQVAAQAAQNFIPAFLELGGKDPAIVLASADLDNAVNGIIRSAAGSAGQACMSLESVYADEAIFDALVHKLIAAANRVELNYPDIHAGHIGPLIFAGQAETIARQLDDARSKGAIIHCGGAIETLGGGLWCRPTVLTGIRDDMLLMSEETFGPLIPVIPFKQPQEAVELANQSKFGLSASVFAGTVAEAEPIARALNAGAVNINDASLTTVVHDVEKNSFGLSGMGASRMGVSGLMRFFRKKALLIQQAPSLPLDIFDERNAAGSL